MTPSSLAHAIAQYSTLTLAEAKECADELYGLMDGDDFDYDTAADHLLSWGCDPDALDWFI